MTSKASSNGDVEINIYFKQGADPDMATVNVQNRVTRAQALLPADVNKVGVKVEKRQNNILRIFAVRSADGKYDLYRYQHQTETDACHRCGQCAELG